MLLALRETLFAGSDMHTASLRKFPGVSHSEREWRIPSTIPTLRVEDGCSCARYPTHARTNGVKPFVGAKMTTTSAFGGIAAAIGCQVRFSHTIMNFSVDR
jgi:hypothetical protein